MSWVEVFAVLIVCHLVGDFLFQTDWQALNKRGGLAGGGRKALSALVRHISTYTLCFVPALIWIADDIGAAAAVAMGAGIAVPHLIQDDATLLSAYIALVKGPDAVDNPQVFLAVDQSLHILTLFATALIVTA